MMKKVFVISGCLHKPDTSSTITEALKEIVQKSNLKMLNPADSTLQSRMKQEQPPLVIFHKADKHVAALKKMFEKCSPSTRFLQVGDCWEAAKELLKTKINMATAA